jgi:filamin
MCFPVELKDAGEGTLEIGLSGPSGQNIPNNVVALGPSQFEVSYSPVESGQHRANINFNKENVTGMFIDNENLIHANLLPSFNARFNL